MSEVRVNISQGTPVEEFFKTQDKDKVKVQVKVKFKVKTEIQYQALIIC